MRLHVAKELFHDSLCSHTETNTKTHTKIYENLGRITLVFEKIKEHPFRIENFF